jgi:hypothetical protein
MIPPHRRIGAVQSQWQVERLRLAAFGGRLALVGGGWTGQPRPSDAATTLTLERIDVQALLRFLEVPRAGEIEARLGGGIYARVTGGEWSGLALHLETEPGSVRLSRGLIKELLGGALDSKTIEERVEPTLKQYFGDARMIPIDSLRIDGTLGDAQLTLKIPIHNEALSIDFEPRVDRALLWQAWDYLKDAGLRDLEKAKWQPVTPPPQAPARK